MRAARTAVSTSDSPASATSASTSSLAGLIVLRQLPLAASTKDPLTNKPYDDLMSTMERDSGAGAYSNMASVHGDVVGSGVATGRHPGALQEQVVEQAGRAEAEPVRAEPVIARGFVDHDQVLDRVLAGPDTAGRLDPDLAAGGVPEVADGLDHDQCDRQGRRRGH